MKVLTRAFSLLILASVAMLLSSCAETFGTTVVIVALLFAIPWWAYAVALLIVGAVLVSRIKAIRVKLRSAMKILILPLLLFATPAWSECDVRVSRVSDGDTFHARTYTVISAYVAFSEDSGFRLHNVRAPERKEEGWAKAKIDLETLIGGRLVEVRIAEKQPRDRWGRFIVNVKTCDGTDVNQTMRDKGWTDKGR